MRKISAGRIFFFPSQFPLVHAGTELSAYREFLEATADEFGE